MGEDVVRLVLPTGDARLLPEVRELLEQRPAGSQVQHILPGQGIVQEWVVHVGEEPGATDRVIRPNINWARGNKLASRGQHRQQRANARGRASIDLKDGFEENSRFELGMSVGVCVCAHQSQAAWTFFPPVETRAFKLQRQKSQ